MLRYSIVLVLGITALTVFAQPAEDNTGNETHAAFPQWPNRQNKLSPAAEDFSIQALQKEIQTIRQRNEERHLLIQKGIQIWETHWIRSMLSNSNERIRSRIVQDTSLQIAQDLFQETLSDEERYRQIQNRLAEQIRMQKP